MVYTVFMHWRPSLPGWWPGKRCPNDEALADIRDALLVIEARLADTERITWKLDKRAYRHPAEEVDAPEKEPPVPARLPNAFLDGSFR